jgi:signal transduction histidine kinase/CheY-like chemotaxis protein
VWLDRISRRPASLRSILFAVILVSMVPTLIFSALLLLHYAKNQEERASVELMSSARGLATNIDAVFEKAEVILRVLAGSSMLASDDLSGFERRLRSAMEETGRTFILSDRLGRELIDTALPPGQAPPAVENPRAFEPAFQGNVAITGVYFDAVTGKAVTAIAVPVKNRDGTIERVLSTEISADDFSSLMSNPGVPSDWIVSVVDGSGIHLVRSRLNDRFAGRSLVPELLAFLEKKGEGTLPSVSHEGIPLISALARARSGYYAALGMPEATLRSPLNRQLLQLFMIGALMLALALAASYHLVRRISSSVRALTEDARAIGRGEVVPPPPSFVRELVIIGEALSIASRDLRQRAAALAELTAALESKVAERTSELVAEMKRREESEDRIRQMQKMEAVGHLTGGLAHDFNNMLAVVLGSLEMLERRMERGETNVSRYIEAARKGTERAVSLTKRLLAFSRQQALSPQPVDANRLIMGMSDLIRRAVPENILIETVQFAGLWRTHVDPHQLENALLNLVGNARDAMPQGGKLTIETANAYLDDDYARAHSEVMAGQYVMIAVTDTGDGMPPEVLSRVFEPFFTTKPPGEGTGLGLSQVYGFVKQSGGHVKIYSERGQGVTVKLYLPRFFKEGEAPPDESLLSRDMPKAQTRELILVVEDDAAVRSSTVEILSELGYRTCAADCAAQALELLDRHPDVCLLFTDVVMPDMNGRRLAEEALQRRPDLKVLFTTGYTRNAIVHNGVLDPGVELIMKPFSMDQLARKLAQVLYRDAGKG